MIEQKTNNAQRWEVSEPVVRIRELFDLVFWYTDGLHDLELVLKTGGFCGNLALLSLVCGFCRGTGCGFGDILFGIGVKTFNVFAKELEFTNNFVCGRLHVSKEYYEVIVRDNNEQDKRTLIGIPVQWNP